MVVPGDMPPLLSTTRPPAAAKRPESCIPAGAGRTSLLPPGGVRKKPSAGILTTSTTAAGRRTARITTTTAATARPAAAIEAATATAPTPLVSRPALRLRDQNATSATRVVRPEPASKPSILTAPARMPPPYDRPSPAGHRPPTVARTGNRPPLTPKIAARPQALQHQTPTLATPLARRPAPESTLTANGIGTRDRDELTFPVSAFLGSNVTPRSAARQNRVDSANSTPSGTPNPDRHDPSETRPGLGVAGPGTDEAHKRPVVTLSPASDASAGIKPDRDSKFFYASDAQKQPALATNPKQLTTQPPKPATFFYANGNTVQQRQGAAPRPFSPSLPSPSAQDGLPSKFVYADGALELQPPAKIGPSSQKSSGSVISTTSRLPTTRPAPSPRAPSPVKAPTKATAKSPNNSANHLAPRSPNSVVSLQTEAQASLAKVSSEALQSTVSHRRTSSGATTAPSSSARTITTDGSAPSSGSTSPCNPPQPGLTLPSNPATAGFASLLQAAEDFAESEEGKSESLNSLNKTSQDGQVTDLVASARRERKVQDLEITNASLEAINRTLERQLRKQTAELRRYQRLSRSGRLSLGSPGSRIPSNSTVDGGGLARAGMGLDDLSEEESEIAAEDAELEELEDEQDDEDLSGSEGSGQLSPGATALRHEKRRREERRLQLDLSKHQQLLVDSQKINQSLKRCLGWTEELIKEGKRALAYQVRVSDVELGGRVLAPEEVERRERGENGAEDAIYAIDALGVGSLVEIEPPSSTTPRRASNEPPDRDSGVELPPADGG